MSIITTDRKDRKRQPEDLSLLQPWQGEDGQGGVQIVSPQAQPQPGVMPQPAQPAPVQPQPQPTTMSVPVAPALPAPVQPQAQPQPAPDPNAVTPALDPRPAQEYQDRLKQGYEAAGMQAPQPTPEAPLGKDLHIPSRELRDAPRDKRPAPVAPVAPAAVPGTGPVIPLDAPSSVVTKATSDPFVSRHKKLVDKRNKIIEDGGTPSPKLLEDITKSWKQAGIRVWVITKEYEDAKVEKEYAAANKAREAENDAAKANGIKDEKERAAKVDLNVRKQANAAGAALTAGDIDEAIAIAQAAKEQYPNADNTDLDKIIAKAVAAKKAIADKEASNAKELAKDKLAKVRAKIAKLEAANSLVGMEQLRQEEKALTDEYHGMLGEQSADPDADPAGEMQAGQVPEGTTATHPETGQRVIMQNGKWVPVQ